MDNNNEIAQEELRQFILSDYDLYRQQEVPIRTNLERKLKRGTYDHTKAPKLWLYLVNSGARKYVKEYCSREDTIRRIFPVKIREELAQKMADEWAEERAKLKARYGREIWTDGLLVWYN
tara:strand:- start:135 stop:494 length:360 start_codon:yes stop_codon:yes gene_type:complete